MPVDAPGIKIASGKIAAKLRADLAGIADAIARQNSRSIESAVCMQAPVTPGHARVRKPRASR
jgi:hypothetical protein